MGLDLRPLRWPADRAMLARLDTAFTSDRIARIERVPDAFVRVELPLEPPVRKAYPFADGLDNLPGFDWVRVVADQERLIGVAALRLERWNRRANLYHLYVDASARGQGVGRALIEAALDAAGSLGARCVWAETQTWNVGAIRFYERMGFSWCGLDLSLYDPATVLAEEAALFFSRPIP